MATSSSNSAQRAEPQAAAQAVKRVPFLDLRVSDEEERRELIEAVDRVLRHGRILLGPEVEELEGRFADFVGRRFAIGVNSGTDALILLMRSLGLGPGDEVITTPLSFIATANAVRLVGATPVFADIADDLNLDPATIEPLVTKRTKAVVAVHWAGKICQMEALERVAEKQGLTLLEDCSQAFGATRRGRPSGSWGRLAGFSMNCMKGLASLGEAGMIATDEAELHERLVALRYHGLKNREYCHFLSHNGRIDTIQAAMLLKRFDRYPEVLRRRRANARFYDEALAGLVRSLPPEPDCEDAYYTYTIEADRRDELKAFLEARGIECKIQHDPLMPLQPIYEGRFAGDFPNARRLIKRLLCIPANEKITEEQRGYVAESVRAFYGKA